MIKIKYKILITNYIQFICCFLLFLSISSQAASQSNLQFTIIQNKKKFQLIVEDSKTHIKSTVQLTKSSGSFYHWGNRRAETWSNKMKITPNELQILIQSERSGATGGGLYATSANPFETQEYGKNLLVIEPTRVLKVIDEENWLKLVQKTDAANKIEGAEKINQALGDLGVDAIVQENEKWFCFINSDSLAHLRKPKIEELVAIPWFEETSSSTTVINSFLKFYKSGQIDVLQLPPERFPVFTKAIRGQKLNDAELKFISETISWAGSLDLDGIASGFKKNDPLEKAIQKALKKHSPKIYQKLLGIMKSNQDACSRGMVQILNSIVVSDGQ